jgi:hypothetical protein
MLHQRHSFQEAVDAQSEYDPYWKMMLVVVVMDVDMTVFDPLGEDLQKQLQEESSEDEDADACSGVTVHFRQQVQ